MLQSENPSLMQKLAKYIIHIFRARIDTVNILFGPVLSSETIYTNPYIFSGNINLTWNLYTVRLF